MNLDSSSTAERVSATQTSGAPQPLPASLSGILKSSKEDCAPTEDHPKMTTETSSAASDSSNERGRYSHVCNDDCDPGNRVHCTLVHGWKVEGDSREAKDPPQWWAQVAETG